MRYIQTLFLIFLLIPLNAAADEASTIQPDSTEESLYTLTTIPSLKKNRAESTLKRIKPAIPDAKLVKIEKETVTYRLEVKCFESFHSAKLLRADILKICKTPFIVPVEKSYCVIAGSQMDYSAAVADQKFFASRNLTTSIVKSKVILPQWQIVVGNFTGLKDSVYTANRMSTEGLIATIQPVEKYEKNESKDTLNRLISEEMAFSLK
ncbi:MAG: hypothetical protein PHN84_04900 [Desulfuromonadaceae bacterium]|nr:hypothetical protein [Desulfuromonadaceae bacterium]MDD2856344.1 hypothetical protein [Desulfuromonadaceae bacterium]